MAGVNARPVQTPCGWCNRPITQPPTGRLLRYCNRSHRQRAYEVRTAQRRLQADLQQGLVVRQPAPTVEKTPRPAYPNTVDGWEQMLAHLSAQLSAARFPLERDRLRTALQTALDAAGPGPQRIPHPRRETPPAPPPPVRLSPAAAALADYLTRVYARRTTLSELAAELNAGVPDVRHALAHAVSTGAATTSRDGQPVDVATLAPTDRFKLTAP